ncbi:hypothetical protein J6590_107397, partial [Homalodisca vitripennis]
MPRRKYLTELARALAIPHITRRSSLTNLPISLRQKIKSIVGTPATPAPPPEDGQKTRCVYCPIRKNRYTQARCSGCNHAVCKEHISSTVLTCFQCAAVENPQDA